MRLKVGIVEYFNGSAPHLDAELLLEGYAMLKSIVCDFLALGASVKTILDRRLERCCELGSAEVVWSSGFGEFERELKILSQSVDYMLLIAPEHLLPTFLERLGSAESLNSSPDSIRAASDKCRLAQRLGEAGLDLPEYACFEADATLAEVRSFCMEAGYPVAVKPAVGAGCEGLSLVRCEEELEAAYRKACRIDPNGKVVVQKWCEGLAASVSLIVSDEAILPLSLNRQIVKVGAFNGNSAYLGGVVPLPHPLAEESFKAASKAVGAFKGLRGYVGVDVILADKVLVLEVNPRLTVSYLGLSRVLDGSVARLMVDREYMLSKRSIGFKGYVSFVKALLPSSAKVDGREVVCSPLDAKRCFLLAQAGSYVDSLRRLKAIINSLGAEVEVADLSA